jgi:hypothetical protein
MQKHLSSETLELAFHYEGHVAEFETNYSGGFPAMELEAASRLWRRFEEICFR